MNEVDREVCMRVLGWRWYSMRGKKGLNPANRRVFHFGPRDYRCPDHWKDVVDDAPSGGANELVCNMGMRHPSTDVRDAMLVVEAMRREHGFRLSVIDNGDHWLVLFVPGRSRDVVLRGHPNFPFAVSFAALYAIGGIPWPDVDAMYERAIKEAAR